MSDGVLDGWRTLQRIEQDIVPLSPKVMLTSIAISMRRIATTLETIQAHTSQISGNTDRLATKSDAIAQSVNEMKSTIMHSVDDVLRHNGKVHADTMMLLQTGFEELIKLITLHEQRRIMESHPLMEVTPEGVQNV